MTQLQEITMRAVAIVHRSGSWFRATGSGQRVTLASLFRMGLLERRVWREGKSSADNAHEYQIGANMRGPLGLPDLATPVIPD